MVFGNTKEVMTHRLRTTVLDASGPWCHKLSKAHSELMLLVSCRGTRGFAVLSWSRPWVTSKGQGLS